MKENFPQQTPTRHTSNILLVIFSMVITFVVLEAALRLIGYHPFDIRLLNGRELILRPSAHKERIYEASPNSEGNAWRTQVKINGHGFRDKEYSIEKDAGTFRIVALGDSVTFGNFLLAEDTYPDQLEALWAETGKAVEVLNLGLGGYDTVQEVATLEHIGVQFQPDFVVVGYVINDMGIESANLRYIEQAQNYGSFIYKLRLAQFIRSNLDAIELRMFNDAANRESNFVKNNEAYIKDVSSDQTLVDIVTGLENEVARHGDNIDRYVPWYLSYSRIGRLRYSFEELKNLQDQHDFHVIVVIVPFLHENEDNENIYRFIYNIVEHEAGKVGFDVINMRDEFKAAGFNNLLIRERDGIHPNSLGHSIIANILYTHINSNFITADPAD